MLKQRAILQEACLKRVQYRIRHVKTEFNPTCGVPKQNAMQQYRRRHAKTDLNTAGGVLKPRAIPQEVC